MDYVPYILAAGGVILILSSFVDVSKLKDFLPKKSVVPDGASLASTEDLLREYTKIRSLLVKQLDAAKVAEVDRVILDAVTGGAKHGE